MKTGQIHMNCGKNRGDGIERRWMGFLRAENGMDTVGKPGSFQKPKWGFLSVSSPPSSQNPDR